MDVAALLADREEAPPSGENLEYDMDFVNLELAAAPGEEKQAGNEILPADEPDWRDVRDKALAVLARSQDLRAAAYLAPAMLATEGLPGLAEVTAYIRGCIEDRWETCHPQLDAEDDNDPTMRVNALQNLSTPPGGQSAMPPVMRALRAVPLTDSRGYGRFSLRDIQYATGEAPPPEGADVPDPAAIPAAFQDTDPDLLTRLLEAARSAQDDIKAVDAKFSAEIPGLGPNFDALSRMLGQVVKVLAEHAGSGAGDADAAEAGTTTAGDAPGGGTGPAPAARGAPGSIGSNADVVLALDRILEYYDRHEPSSPLPIILRRAKRLVGADFMTIMRDMAPGGIDNVSVISGEREDED